MYAHTTFPRADFLLGQEPPSPDVTAPFPSGALPPPQLAHLIIPDQFPTGVDLGSSGGGHSASSTSGCSSYSSPNSLGSCGGTQRPSYIQRSISSHSLLKNGYHCHFASPQDFLDMDTSPVRRVFSTGDLPVSLPCYKIQVHIHLGHNLNSDFMGHLCHWTNISVVELLVFCTIEYKSTFIYVTILTVIL